MINSQTAILGAVVGLKQISQNISLVAGLVFVVGGIGLFFIRRGEGLRKKTRGIDKSPRYEVIGALGRKRKKERYTDFEYSPHTTKKYAKKRGWTTEKIRSTIRNANEINLTRDTYTITDPETGKERTYQNLAKVYYMKKKPNQYVVINKYGELVQVSDLKKKKWGSEFRDNFVYQVKQLERERISKKHGKRLGREEAEKQGKRMEKRNKRKREQKEAYKKRLAELLEEK